MNSEFFLEIAGINVRIKSCHVPMEEAKDYRYIEEFLVKEEPKRIDIDIEVKIKAQLPPIVNKEYIFKTRHKTRIRWHLDWVWAKKDGQLLLEGKIFESYPIPYIVYLNEELDRAVVYISPPLNYASHSWQLHYITHGPMQMIFIYYLAKKRLGLITHSTGIKDRGKGLLFTGRSGAGKTTIAGIWRKNSDANILNDDRIIIRDTPEGFVLYRAIWHGAGNTYANRSAVCAPFKKIFVIYQSQINEARLLSPKEAFSQIFPCMFPVFWCRKCMEFTSEFLSKVVQSIPAYKLGFAKDSRIIKYIRSENY